MAFECAKSRVDVCAGETTNLGLDSERSFFASDFEAPLKITFFEVIVRVAGAWSFRVTY